MNVKTAGCGYLFFSPYWCGAEYIPAVDPKLTVGARFPDIELPDTEGKLQRLSAIQGWDPMAVIFYRGQF
jgi:hypothetical protein